ncbi:MAG: hypothetical protein B7Y25_03415 [Alphaproteobacteria bacterium 16-39-46]|nr:MAG: hypothetical protein B7Y25_03415 [Alphaproteobacteria bacterium 16-39-46]OZA43332.1 MAG: hypothetical protein B7X84_03545 [Alphaproteobacteria bacterium 17-39-52]HQS83936.1 hypothetical protein [Alphaproteobacteria bacterium]HQS93778.1 hypothetical protein [Alphaproteobacteria bacterium]
MSYKKYYLFFFCAVLILSTFLFLKDAYCFDAAAENAEEGGALLKRKSGSTFRSKSRKEFEAKLSLMNANVQRCLDEKKPDVDQFWSTAFDKPLDFQKILIHLIGSDLKKPEGHFRLVMFGGENASFKFYYKRKKLDESGESEEEMLANIVFISDFSQFSQKLKAHQKFVKQRVSYNFVSLIKRPLQNLEDYYVLKLFLNTLDGIFLRSLHELSWHGVPNQKSTRDVLIGAENNKGIIVSYNKKVLRREDFVPQEMRDVSQKSEHSEDVGSLTSLQIKKSSEYMDANDVEEERDSEDDEYMNVFAMVDAAE